MRYINKDKFKLRALTQGNNQISRFTNTTDFLMPSDYRIEVFAQYFDTPIDMAISDNGDIFIAESGISSGNARILRLRNGQVDVIAENFIVPITGITYMDGSLYITHKTVITVLKPDGTRQNILSGLPCNGDFGLSNLNFGPDGKMYFGLGAATNSGVVGPDNKWVFDHPFLHDYPAIDLTLTGTNFATNNIFSEGKERVFTGGFSPYGIPSDRNKVIPGTIKASGSILRANRDGSGLELVAWGLRNPLHLKFSRDYKLFVSNRGYDVRGSRPIANAPDEFYQIQPGTWYGWPDYSAGEPVNLPKFSPEGGPQPQFLLSEHPNTPPRPFATFAPHTTITGFDFNYNRNFSNSGEVYIAEFGSYGPLTLGKSTPYYGIGHKVSRINPVTGEVSTFIINKSGLPAYISNEGGFGRPVDIHFGPDGSMYIVDMGFSNPNDFFDYIIPNTGVLWRVTRVTN